MRFGLNLETRPTPQLAEYYVDYQKWKALLKSNMFAELQASFDDGLVRVAEGLTHRQRLLDRRKLRFDRVFERLTSPWDPQNRPAEVRSAYALVNALATECCTHLLYMRTIHRAVERMTGKLRQVPPSLVSSVSLEVLGSAIAQAEQREAHRLKTVNRALCQMSRVLNLHRHGSDKKNLQRISPRLLDQRGARALFSQLRRVLDADETEAEPPLQASAPESNADNARLSGLRRSCNSNQHGFEQWLQEFMSSEGNQSSALLSRVPNIPLLKQALYWAFIHDKDYGRQRQGRSSPKGKAAMLSSIRVPPNRLERENKSPLIRAAIQGNVEEVRTLLQQGCDINARDWRNWRAMDHAAYRGFPDLVTLFRGVLDARSDVPLFNEYPLYNDDVPRRYPRLGTAGRGRNEIFISVRDNAAVDITAYRASVAPAQIPDSSLSLQVTGIGCDQDDLLYLLRLPVMEDLSNQPCQFATADLSRAQIQFELFSSVAPDQPSDKPIAVGILLPSVLHGCLGAERESLVRSHTVPLLRLGGDAQVLGTVTFDVLISLPFRGPEPLPIRPMPLPSTGKTLLAGHRCVEQDHAHTEHSLISENSIASFNRAIELGAAIVEFGVQVTKDHVAVVYHDLVVGEANLEVPVHSMTYDAMVEATAANRGINGLASSTTSTARSGDPPVSPLGEVLMELDETICLNMEIKYPMLDEAQCWGMDHYAMELNLFLDTILATISQNTGTRPIILSSFNPEACILLSRKQDAYPVLFLNDSSNWPADDPRARSLQSAVHFARAWGLHGVAMASEPLVSSPGLIDMVRRQGLYCASYGPLNDDIACAKIQANANLDMIIVNKVRRIATAFGKV